MTMAVSLRRVLWGPPTLAAYALLVVPFAVGWLRTSWMTPLAMPGYVLYVTGTAIGNAVAPRFDLWVYWMPFLAGCYGLAVAIGYSYDRIRTLISSTDSVRVE